LPPGQTVTDLAGTATTGYHSNFYVYHNSTGYHMANVVPVGTQLIPVYYAVSLGTSPSISVTASHELAETVTDPNGTGFRDPLNPYGGEVADIYEFLGPFTLDGFPVSILSGPQGQQITSAGVTGAIAKAPATPQSFYSLIIDEIEALAYEYLSMFDPHFAPQAQAAQEAVISNPYYGTSQGQMGIFLGEMMFYSAF